jgi:metal-responsive CopG/Arc/MetJ family transcriptional regulator
MPSSLPKVGLHVTPALLRSLDEAARKAGIDRSRWIRRALVRAVAEHDGSNDPLRVCFEIDPGTGKASIIGGDGR